jgi:hypothetical protein
MQQSSLSSSAKRPKKQRAGDATADEPTTFTQKAPHFFTTFLNARDS